MKKNWIAIASLIAFIFAWEFLVVRPYNVKNQPQQPQITESSSSISPTSSVDTKLTTTLNPVAPESIRIVGQEINPSESFVLTLGEDTLAYVTPKGQMGRATFPKYKEVGPKDKSGPLFTLPRGYSWQSSSPVVQQCLNQMVPVFNEKQKISFRGFSEGIECSLIYTASVEKPGIVNTEFLLNGITKTEGSLYLTAVGSLGHGPALDHNSLQVFVDGEQEKIRDKDLFKQKTYQGSVGWLLWGDRYFASALIPRGTFVPNVFNDKGPDEGMARFGFEYPILAKGGEPFRVNLEAFFGPRDVKSLDAAEPGMGAAVEFGWFPRISQALLWCLVELNKVFKNFGLSIIVLTLIVRVLFWPLNKKVYQSGLKMKALQPHIEALKKKYGNDKAKAQEMNLEMIGLYKKHKVNPLGSCLPLLLQMPIFFGLYGALNHSIDLFQAPFFGWISDLSSPDPFYVFPVLWTASLIGYVFLNPTPQQAQANMPDMKWIMIAMNIFFGYLSKDWPAGLTIYLFVSNFVGITQQYVMQRAAHKLQPIQEGA